MLLCAKAMSSCDPATRLLYLNRVKQRIILLVSESSKGLVYLRVENVDLSDCHVFDIAALLISGTVILTSKLEQFYLVNKTYWELSQLKKQVVICYMHSLET